MGLGFQICVYVVPTATFGWCGNNVLTPLSSVSVCTCDEGQASSTNAFLSPRWGGLLVYNVNTSVDSVTERQQNVDMLPVLSVFASQLRLLLGFHSTVSYCSAGSRVERIDLLHFLARCRKSWLKQALYVLSFSLDFCLSVSIVLLTMATFVLC